MDQIKSGLSDLEKSVLPWLGRTMKAMDYFIVDTFSAHGLALTKAQMILLKVLSANDGLPQSNLAFITNRDKASLTRLIDTMEKKGLVERSSSNNDKRIKLVVITESGKKTFKKALPVLMEITRNVQHNISKSELETTINVLKKISVNINADELTTPLKTN